MFLAKIANLPMTDNYLSPSYTQETYLVVVTTLKTTIYFYSIFLLLSSLYYSMWVFGEYPLENQHILPSPKVSHVLKQRCGTLPINMFESLLPPMIYTGSLMTTFSSHQPSLPCTSDSLSATSTSLLLEIHRYSKESITNATSAKSYPTTHASTKLLP